MHSIGSTLEHALRELKCETKIKEYLVLEAWGKIVGENIARQAHPEGFRDDKLFVKVSTPAWMCQLESMKRIIIERIDKKVKQGVVKEIHFSLGEIPSPKVPKAMTADEVWQNAKIDEVYLESIKKDLSYIRDPQIREVLSRIMIKDAKLRRFRGGWDSHPYHE